MNMGLELIQNYWTDLAQWRPEFMAVYAMLTASAVTAGLMMRVVGGIPYVVFIVGFAVMYFSAYLANFMGRDYVLPSLELFQKTIALSFTGQLFGALVILVIFKVKEGHSKRF